MAVTLVQAKLNTLDAIQAGVIDEFRKNNILFDKITFDDSVTPGSSGKTLTYGYQRVTTQPTAAFRAINAEFTPQEAQKTRCSVDLKVFGGSFQIDRVLARTGGLVDEVQFQIAQKVKAAASLFCDTFINGDTGSDANAFDGIAKAVTGSSTEYNTAAVVDLSTSALLDSNYKTFLDMLDEYISGLDGTPDMLMGNTKLMSKIRAAARRAGYLTPSEDAFGKMIETYNGIPLVDLGAKPGSTNPISPIVSRTVGSAQTGITDLFSVRLGLDGVHGVSIAGQNPIETYLPNMKLPGAVKTGEIEMVAAVAIKATKAAGIFRNIKVQ